MWEHEEQHDRYGTPMALMLLPFWTDGCIGSMEGLYFEASSTTPYHFLNQDELSVGPSNAERDLPYEAGRPTKADFDLGIEHLQMLGVRYYMAIYDGTEGIAATASNPSLTQVATSGPWTVFQVSRRPSSSQPLKNEPAVLDRADRRTGLSGRTPPCAGTPNRRLDVQDADDGPAAGSHGDAALVHGPRRLGHVLAAQAGPATTGSWFGHVATRRRRSPSRRRRSPTSRRATTRISLRREPDRRARCW